MVGLKTGFLNGDDMDNHNIEDHNKDHHGKDNEDNHNKGNHQIFFTYILCIYFHRIGPLGRFDHTVAMSVVCLYVCMSLFMQFFCV